MSDAENSMPESGSPSSLAETLRQAREARGLDLTAVARLTSVRKDYLEALEQDRHEDLPESVYVRNFVKLFAQAVGIDGRAAVEMYGSERLNPAVATVPGSAVPRGNVRTQRSDSAEPPQVVREPAPARRHQSPDYVSTGRSHSSRRPVFATWLPSLLLIIVVVGLAVWGFNSTLFPSGTATPNGNGGVTGEPVATPVSPADEDEREDGTLAGFVGTTRLSVVTEPSGARVLIDAFPLEGVTPISNAPVTALDNRAIRVELDGYEPFEAEFDLTFNRNLSFVLSPQADEPDAPTETDSAAGTEESGALATASAGQIMLSVTDESWLEIYPGIARSGTPLVYTVAQAGQSYDFDLPVYVHVGNAAGIDVTVSGRALGALGSAGEVLGRAFTEGD